MVERVAGITFTGTGDADGYLTGTSNAGVYPGREGNLVLTSNGTLNQRVRVTDVIGTTKVGLQFVTEGSPQRPSYGHNSLAAYGAGATLILEAGLAPVKGDGSRLDSIWS
jgi:hypothetical protein